MCLNKYYLAPIVRELSRAASGQTENKLFTLAKAPRALWKRARHPHMTHRLAAAVQSTETHAHKSGSDVTGVITHTSQGRQSVTSEGRSDGEERAETVFGVSPMWPLHKTFVHLHKLKSNRLLPHWQAVLPRHTC